MIFTEGVIGNIENKKMKKNIVLFLTGCIKPNGMQYTYLQNPEIREKQYIEAISFYLNNTNLKILFVENSGIDIANTFQNHKNYDRLEILTFNGNNFDKSLGKGFGEMLIMEYAYNNSLLIKNADFVFKITGRYKVLNIKSIINDYREKNTDIDIILNFKPNLLFADSRIFGFKPNFLKDYFFKYKDIINDGESVYFEHALAKAALVSISNNKKYSKFTSFPIYSGIKGTSGTKYRDSFLYWVYKTFLLKSMIKFQKLLQIN